MHTSTAHTGLAVSLRDIEWAGKQLANKQATQPLVIKVEE